ncbi:MAG: 3-oxoacyl-[acyl-carrier protein] reductase [Candidatus Marivariicella framensis]|jgi:3-oxoacyl-[acyl-carrier protein] reductase|tara:strand:- start:2522 stop:3205 length:684 start_codon:yes stop_codon:yes gene_type:complete
MINKKTILITGASNGIGFEIAKTAASLGHKVIAISRDITNLKPLINVDSYSVDITNDSLIESFVKNLIQKKIKLDILINNAGLLVNMPFEETSIKTFKNVYNVNVFGVVSVIRMCLPIMNKKSHVLNISSMGGVQGSSKFPGLSAYSSSKGALITLTELLAEEYNETGPSFNVLALGAVQTEMLEKAFPGYKSNVSAKKMASYILEFSISGHELYNGKLIPVSLSTP